MPYADRIYYLILPMPYVIIRFEYSTMGGVMRRHGKILVIIAVGVPMVYLGGLAQRSQTITVGVEAALMMACAPASFGPITFGLGNGHPPTYNLGSWSCNIDALTTYMLNASFALISASPNPPSGVSANSFSQSCTSDEPGQGAFCLATAPVNFGPITLAQGDNTAGTDGDDYSGAIFVNVTGWNFSPGEAVAGVIIYQVFDTKP